VARDGVDVLARGVDMLARLKAGPTTVRRFRLPKNWFLDCRRNTLCLTQAGPTELDILEKFDCL
jgi:hypothetical protein